MATAIITIVSFNWFMNPYGFYHSLEIKGINKFKSISAGKLRMANAWNIYKQKPNCIILGSSRSIYGLNSNHPGWDCQEVYNLAHHGTNMYETLRYFQHAHALEAQKRVVLGLDFLMFNAFDQKGKQGFDESSFITTANGNINSQFSSYKKFLMLGSIDTLNDSIQILFNENDLEANQNLEKIQLLGGLRKLFRKVEKKHMNKTWYKRPHNYQFFAPETGQSSFDNLRKLLDIAYRDKIDLRMLISPSHARLWEALHAVGLWSKFEQWKREVVTINEQQAKKYGKQPFPLWDFSGYNAYTTETITDNMKWYWESSHYKQELGNIVLNSVFEAKIAEDFGVLINAKNIDKHLADIRIKQQQYRKSHPIDAAEVKKLAEETAKLRK